ncbi:uncharacterized protein LOC112689577, partial [Sipha flava]|uniref:Uncharacterized protein LOC112689577 n=2 Tax=Sipha flava TaxID=143950 RepID=A0A8B8G956_9HEMI
MNSQYNNSYESDNENDLAFCYNCEEIFYVTDETTCPTCNSGSIEIGIELIPPTPGESANMPDSSDSPDSPNSPDNPGPSTSSDINSNPQSRNTESSEEVSIRPRQMNTISTPPVLNQERGYYFTNLIRDFDAISADDVLRTHITNLSLLRALFDAQNQDVAFNLPLSMEEIDIIPTSIISQELL